MMMRKVVHLKQNIIGGMCTCGRGMEAAAGAAAREGAKGRCGQENRTWCTTYGHCRLRRVVRAIRAALLGVELAAVASERAVRSVSGDQQIACGI